MNTKATYIINGDEYEVTIIKVSPSGKTKWAAFDSFYNPVVKFTLRSDGRFIRSGGRYGTLKEGRPAGGCKVSREF